MAEECSSCWLMIADDEIHVVTEEFAPVLDDGDLTGFSMSAAFCADDCPGDCDQGCPPA